MRTSRAFAAALVVAVGLGADQRAWRSADPAYAWSFPADHWAHPDYKTEWWYFTGHLRAANDSTRRFGYQFTLFRIGVPRAAQALDSEWATDAIIMGHAAVADLTDGRRWFSELLYRATPFLAQFGAYPDTTIAWSRAPAGTAGRWTLQWNGAGFSFAMRDDRQRLAFDLTTTPAKPRVFQGPNGFSRKTAEGSNASLYYSFTRLRTEGVLSIGGDTVPVVGESWMDKEFGSDALAESQVGWDWFSLQLDDGREIMLYVLRDSSGADYGHATLVSETGVTRYLTASQWTIRTLDTWTSPTTGATYPSGWLVSIPGAALELEVRPVMLDQENVGRVVPELYYWEGAVDVLGADGGRLGRGYVELTGYGSGRRLGF